MPDGFKWAALELDDYNNAERWGPFRETLENAQILAGPWYTEGANIATTPADAHFTIAELESEQDRQGVLSAPRPTMPHFVITNYTPLTDGSGVPLPDKAAPLIELGYHCMTESYVGDSPGMNPDDMHQRAIDLGWPTSIPIGGIHNYPVWGYDEWFARHHINGYYLAEYLDL